MTVTATIIPFPGANREAEVDAAIQSAEAAIQAYRELQTIRVPRDVIMERTRSIKLDPASLMVHPDNPEWTFTSVAIRFMIGKMGYDAPVQ